MTPVVSDTAETSMAEGGAIVRCYDSVSGVRLLRAYQLVAICVESEQQAGVTV